MKKKKKTYYYSGRHAIKILHIINNKAIIEHLENGFIGSEAKGYHRINKGEMSITIIVNCYEKKRG